MDLIVIGFTNVTFKFNFLIYIIRKMLVMLKGHLNHLKDSIFECFFKEYNTLSSFLLFTNIEIFE